MNLWPVTERELRLNARRPRTYYVRVLTATVVVLVSLGMLYVGFARVLNPGSAGRGLFLLLSCVGAAYVVFDGALMTGDCLSQEKREGTLSLLRITGLSGPEIVLGKLISRITHSAYCLLAAVPALAIALFLGGVTGTDVFRLAIALFNGLFVCAAIGMLASSVCIQERRALGWAIGGSLIWALGTPALGWAVAHLQRAPAAPPLLVLATPAGAFLDTLRVFPTLPGPGFAFWPSILWTHVLGWSVLAAASVAVTHSHERQFGAITVRQAIAAARKRSPRPPRSVSGYHRLQGGEVNPFVWMTAMRGQRGLGVTPALGLFALTWALGWYCGRSYWFEWGVYVGTVSALHLVLMFFLVIQAARGPSEDRREGILEMLLTTPAGPDLYLPGRLLSLKRQCLRPLLLVLGVDIGLLAAGLYEIGPPSPEWLQWIGAFLVLTVKLIVDLYVLSWVAVWQGLKLAHTGRAVRRTLFYVLVVRWILLLGLISVLGLMTGGIAFQAEAAAGIGTVGYILLFIMCTLHFAGLAMGELQDNLRALALGSGDTDAISLVRRT